MSHDGTNVEREKTGECSVKKEEIHDTHYTSREQDLGKTGEILGLQISIIQRISSNACEMNSK